MFISVASKLGRDGIHRLILGHPSGSFHAVELPWLVPDFGLGYKEMGGNGDQLYLGHDKLSKLVNFPHLKK